MVSGYARVLSRRADAKGKGKGKAAHPLSYHQREIRDRHLDGRHETPIGGREVVGRRIDGQMKGSQPFAA